MYQWVLSVGVDRAIVVWTLSTGRPLRRLEGHLSTVTDVAAVDSHHLIVSVSNDGTIKLW